VLPYLALRQDRRGATNRIGRSRMAGRSGGFLMTYRKLSVMVAEVRAIATAALAATTLSATGFVAGPALAQQPAQPPAAPKPATPPRPPAAPRPAAPAAQPQKPAAAAPAPTAPQSQAAAPVPAPEMPPLIYSPWAKFCVKDNNEPNAKEACFTGKDGRTEDGRPVVAAALIEPEGEPKKVFRVTLPMPVKLPYGARIVIDTAPELTAVFFTCFPTGCIAEFEGTSDLIGKLKKGQTLNLQAVNLAGNPFSFPLPLTDNTGNSFAKANEGPPIDPKVFEEQQTKLQDELQKRADDARKKLEGQSGPAPGAPK
jgi:invasion protein IalB